MPADLFLDLLSESFGCGELLAQGLYAGVSGACDPSATLTPTTVS